jgi:hypothetical protein
MKIPFVDTAWAHMPNLFFKDMKKATSKYRQMNGMQINLRLGVH